MQAAWKSAMQFEELEVWEIGKRLAVNVYRGTSELRDYGFRNQVTRSALSIPSNVAEGVEKRSDKEIIHYLTIAKASCAEFKTQAMIGIEIAYIDAARAREWIADVDTIGRMLGGFIKYLESKSASP